ncbi:MAG: class I SAM-dependent methyltransferase [Clostridia bacterium]|nr:class I SAM-dependent methyltransferase [Clostridia bacterium]
MITLKKELNGNILDIGGGGEGVIGQLYGNRVVAIDNCQEELDDAPDGFKKLLMDATDLRFPDETFDNVTSFYTLMFMNEADQRKAIGEVERVLKTNGELHIWDCNIDSAYPEPFCVDVDVLLPDRKIHTTYGVGKMGQQSFESVLQMCKNAGFRMETAETNGVHFYIKCKKGAD